MSQDTLYLRELEESDIPEILSWFDGEAGRLAHGMQGRITAEALRPDPAAHRGVRVGVVPDGRWPSWPSAARTGRRGRRSSWSPIWPGCAGTSSSPTAGPTCPGTCTCASPTPSAPAWPVLCGSCLLYTSPSPRD